MSSFVLKIIAILSMLCDHLGYITFNEFTFINYLGRFSFPIFAFLITEGYRHTSNLKKYFYRLLIFACISQIPFMLFINSFRGDFVLNILFTLTLGLLTITVYEKINNKILGIVFTIFCATIAHFFPFDYGWFGITVIFIFHIFKNKHVLMNFFFIIATFINYFYKFIIYLNIEYLGIILFACLALIPINLYNEKKGKNLKYFLYIFYPLHLILLYLLNFIV